LNGAQIMSAMSDFWSKLPPPTQQPNASVAPVSQAEFHDLAQQGISTPRDQSYLSQGESPEERPYRYVRHIEDGSDPGAGGPNYTPSAALIHKDRIDSDPDGNNIINLPFGSIPTNIANAVIQHFGLPSDKSAPLSVDTLLPSDLLKGPTPSGAPDGGDTSNQDSLTDGGGTSNQAPTDGGGGTNDQSPPSGAGDNSPDQAPPDGGDQG
jgi:hypothetical protein